MGRGLDGEPDGQLEAAVGVGACLEDPAQLFDALARQTLVGLMNGLATGTVLGLCALIWERNAVLAAILTFAETVNLTISGFFGALVPLVLKRLRLDPALGSSIFVTTATDVGGFLSFLGTATLLISWLHP